MPLKFETYANAEDLLLAKLLLISFNIEIDRIKI